MQHIFENFFILCNLIQLHIALCYIVFNFTKTGFAVFVESALAFYITLV